MHIMQTLATFSAMTSALQGWMSHSLATSSLLQAVGVHPGAAGTAGATAAVKWITKDGIGAFGRLLVSRSPGKTKSDSVT
jgi:Vitamin B6 photo-protection and homoeostasis